MGALGSLRRTAQTYSMVLSWAVGIRREILLTGAPSRAARAYTRTGIPAPCRMRASSQRTTSEPPQGSSPRTQRRLAKRATPVSKRFAVFIANSREHAVFDWRHRLRQALWIIRPIQPQRRPHSPAAKRGQRREAMG